MDQETVNELNTPIPGQSLTQDPAIPQSWETPPEITDVAEARELIFKQITDPTRIGYLLLTLDSGIPVSKVANMAVKQGVFEGLWTPDLMLLLLEPTALMMIAVAKEAGIEPTIIDKKLQQASVNYLDVIREMGIEEGEIEAAIPEETGLMSPTESIQ